MDNDNKLTAQNLSLIVPTREALVHKYTQNVLCTQFIVISTAVGQNPLVVRPLYQDVILVFLPLYD